MPISWHFDRGKGHVVAKLSGSTGIEDIRAMLQAIVASGECPPDAPALWDAREFNFGEIGRDFQERLVEAQKDFPGRGAARIAVVVADDLGFGIMRMYQAIAHDLHREIRVFRDMAHAEGWLADG